MGGRRS